MHELILEIFDMVNVKIPDLPETEQNIEGHAKEFLATIEKHTSQAFCDDIEKSFFEVLGIAERKGFELGVKYMAKLLFECLS